MTYQFSMPTYVISAKHFLEIDNWLTNLDDPDPKNGDQVVDTGVGIYHFVVKSEYEDVPIKELLEPRKD